MDNTPLPPTKGKRGKPLQKFDLELVEKLAARGLSYKQLAITLSMSQKAPYTQPCVSRSHRPRSG